MIRVEAPPSIEIVSLLLFCWDKTNSARNDLELWSGADYIRVLKLLRELQNLLHLHIRRGLGVVAEQRLCARGADHQPCT